MNSWTIRFINIALWFGSLLLSVSVFSLIYGPSSFPFVFRITMMFALPVAFLYLPVVIALRDAEGGRIWTILRSGIVIGPACMAIWGVVLSLRGAPSIWEGDGIGPGLGSVLLFALIVGFLTTAVYVIALKVIYWRRRSRIATTGPSQAASTGASRPV